LEVPVGENDPVRSRGYPFLITFAKRERVHLSLLSLRPGMAYLPQGQPPPPIVRSCFNVNRRGSSGHNDVRTAYSDL